MKVLALGASRNVGYHTSLRLLERGDTVTFLLRSTAAFDNDQAMAPHIASGKARLVQGDALKEEDVQRAWPTASAATAGSNDEGQVDLLLITIGTQKGSFHPIKGFLVDPHDICSKTILNALYTCPTSATPRIVVMSSTGLGSSHSALPLIYKPLYGWLLAAAHEDKVGLERVVHHVGGRKWTEKDVAEEILPAGWDKRLPTRQFETAIIRAAILTDGECTTTYRVGDGDVLSAYTISRKDVAHFLAEGLLKNWAQWQGKTISIAY